MVGFGLIWVWISGYLDTWISEYLGIWTSGYMAVDMEIWMDKNDGRIFEAIEAIGGILPMFGVRGGGW